MSVPNVRHLKIVGFVAALISLSLIFQNCARTATSSTDKTPVIQFAGNGGPYEGKTYASLELCADQTPKTRIFVQNLNSALLLRENCQDVVPSQGLDGTQFSLSQQAPFEMTYQGEPLRMESRQIEFKQGSGTGLLPNSSSAQISMNALTQGNLLVCAVYLYEYDNRDVSLGISDSAGNVFRSAVGLTTFPTLYAAYYAHQYAIYYAENITGGNSTVTATFGLTSGGSELNCMEYSGVASSNALTGSAFNSGATPTNINLGPLNASGNQLLLGFSYSYGKINLSGLGTERYVGTMHSNMVSDRIVPVAGTYSLDFTPFNGANEWWFGHLLAFRGE